MELNNLNIQHDQEHHMFFIKLKNSHAHLNYTLVEKDVIEMTETYVPVEARGMGVAGTIVKHALEHAKNERLKVIPSCPFIERYIQENTEFEDLVYEPNMKSVKASQLN